MDATKMIYRRTTGSGPGGRWSLWLLDCVVRLLAVDMASWLVVATAALLLTDPGEWGTIPAGALYGAGLSYIGFFIGAVLYLPLMLFTTRFWRGWRLTAIVASPLLAAGALVTILPFGTGDLSVPAVWAIGTAAALGTVVPAPGYQSLRGGLLAAAVIVVTAAHLLAAAAWR
jgi:hypothetical protein